jgi:hypothetical protein
VRTRRSGCDVSPHDRRSEPLLYCPRAAPRARRSRLAYAAQALLGAAAGLAYAFFGSILIYVWYDRGGTPALHRATTVFVLTAVAMLAAAAALARGRQWEAMVAGLAASLAAGVSGGLCLLYFR